VRGRISFRRIKTHLGKWSKTNRYFFGRGPDGERKKARTKTWARKYQAAQKWRGVRSLIHACCFAVIFGLTHAPTTTHRTGGWVGGGGVRQGGVLFLFVLQFSISTVSWDTSCPENYRERTEAKAKRK